MFTCSYSIPWYMWPTQSWGLNLNMWTCWRSKVFEICQMLLLLFCLNKTIFGFCSRSQLLQLKFSGKKKLCRELQIAQPPRVSKVANERYLPYLQFCGKTSMWIVMYCRCKSGPKLRLNNENWGLPQDKNKLFLTQYFVRTGNPKYFIVNIQPTPV